MNGANQGNNQVTGHPMSIRQCMFLAGMGGIMPTLARMASTYVTDPSSPLPAVGMYVGLFLFFIIGAILCYAFSERNLRQAFILGVCAPGIITNIVAGVQDIGAQETQVAAQTPSFFDSLSFAKTVYATQPQGEVGLAELPRNRTRGQDVTRQAIISLRADLKDVSVWDKKNILITVGYYEGSRKTIVGKYAVADLTKFDFTVPQTASRIEVIVAGKRLVQFLPKDFKYAELKMDLEFKGRSDFLWALGGKRRPTVGAGALIWTDGDITVKGVPLSRLIGKSARNSSGRIVGRVKGLTLSPERSPLLVVSVKTHSKNKVDVEKTFQLRNVAEVPEGIEIVIGAEVRQWD